MDQKYQGVYSAERDCVCPDVCPGCLCVSDEHHIVDCGEDGHCDDHGCIHYIPAGAAQDFRAAGRKESCVFDF